MGPFLVIKLAESGASSGDHAQAVLRAAAKPVARRMDPAGQGVHYEELKAELLASGVVIRGPSQGKTMHAALSGAAARRDFRALGGGRFAWLDDG